MLNSITTSLFMRKHGSLRMQSLTCVTMQGILKAALDSGDVTQAACPLPGCRLPLCHTHVGALLDSHGSSRFDQLLAQHYVNINPFIKW